MKKKEEASLTIASRKHTEIFDKIWIWVTSIIDPPPKLNRVRMHKGKKYPGCVHSR